MSAQDREDMVEDDNFNLYQSAIQRHFKKWFDKHLDELFVLSSRHNRWDRNDLVLKRDPNTIVHETYYDNLDSENGREMILRPFFNYMVRNSKPRPKKKK